MSLVLLEGQEAGVKLQLAESGYCLRGRCFSCLIRDTYVVVKDHQHR